MGILDFFRRVETLSPDGVRDLLRTKGHDEVNLVDVREPEEYDQGHLPGARLIPVKDLPDRVGELDPSKPTVAYCAAGVRGRTAAGVLSRAGFKQVWNMEGGIRAWMGQTVEGMPDAGMTWFPGAGQPRELLALCWLLEDGSRSFYAKLAESLEDEEAAGLFAQTAEAETRHGDLLLQLYEGLVGEKPGQDFPASALGGERPPDILEGGMRVSEALEWAKGKKLAEVMMLSLGLEASAYDLAARMSRQPGAPGAQDAFRRIADQEKQHAEQMTALFEKWL